MRPICDQDFNWATRRSTPVHLRALSGRANEFRQDGPKPARGMQQAFSFWSHHGFSQSHQRAHRLGELLCQTNCESPCRLQEDILHPGNLPAQPKFTGHTQQDARKLFLDGSQRQRQSCRSHNGGRAPRFSGMQKGFRWIGH